MIKSDTIGYRIAWGLKQKGILPTIASKQLGWAASYLGKVISGDIKELSFPRGMALAKYLGLDPFWLSTGIMLSEITLIKGPKKRSISENPDSPLFAFYVPLIRWQEAGKSISSAHDIQDKRRYPAIQLAGSAGLGTFALMADGESMIDSLNHHMSFYPGDFLFFDPDERPFINCYVLARHQSQKTAIFRRLSLDCGEPYLLAHNKRQFPALGLTPEWKVIGVLIERHTRQDTLIMQANKPRKIKFLDEFI